MTVSNDEEVVLPVSPIALMNEDEYPTPVEPTIGELYASVGSRVMLWSKAFEEAGRAIIGLPRSGDRIYGAQHDFNKDTYANIYRKVELVHRGVDTTADHVMYNGFRIHGIDQEKVEFINDWVDYIGLQVLLHSVVRHLQIYGDCFIEVVYDDTSDWRVVDLKLLDPATMFIYAHENGDIIGYIQHPKSYRWRDDPKTLPDKYRGAGRQGKDKNWKAAVKATDPKAVVFDPHEIIHMSWDPMPDSYYGSSTLESMKRTLTTYIGMLQDVSVLIRRYGHPMVVWKVGTPEEPGNMKMLREFEKAINSRNIGQDPVVPGIIDWDVISAGEKSMNIEPYIKALRDDLFQGIGVPEPVLGGTSAGGLAGSEVMQESFSRKNISFQKFIESEVKRQLFTKVLGFGPYEPVTREMWKSVPNITFNPPETTEQKYLRVKTGLDGNVYTIEESRVELGYPEKIKEGHQRVFDLQMALQKEAARVRPVGIPGETGPSKSSSRQADKTVAQTPSGVQPKQHEGFD